MAGMNQNARIATGRRSVDVSVVGAGITGLVIAWQLARQGVRRVTVYDPAGIGAGATAIQPGGVRQQYATRIACQMAREAYHFYKDLDDRLGTAVGANLDAGGYLFLAETESVLDQLRGSVEIQNELGIPSRVMTPADVAELVPGLDAELIVGGSYCEEDGYFDRPQAVVQAFADACRKQGVEFEQVRVIQITPDGEGVTLQFGDGTVSRSDRVVVAASYDTGSVLGLSAGELSIDREPRYLFYSQPIRERLLEPLVVATERQFAAKQLADGSVLASDLGADGDPAAAKATWYRRVRSTITSLLPILEYVSFPILVDGYYDVTPDHQPIVGPLPQKPGVWIAAGMNGRGFMLAPAIARLVVEGMLGATSPELSALDPTRFARGELIPEQQVV